MRDFNKHWAWGLLAVAITLCVASTASATTVRSLELDEHLSLTDIVVHAAVTQKHAFLAEDGMIYTDTTLEVVEVLHGQLSSKVLTVRQMGGQIGEQVRFLPGDARLAMDSRVVVFLADREPESGVLFLTALAQSEYVATSSTPIGDVELVRDFRGLTFYDTELAVPLGGREAEHTTLDTLRGALQALETAEGN